MPQIWRYLLNWFQKASESRDGNPYKKQGGKGLQAGPPKFSIRHVCVAGAQAAPGRKQ